MGPTRKELLQHIVELIVATHELPTIWPESLTSRAVLNAQPGSVPTCAIPDAV